MSPKKRRRENRGLPKRWRIRSGKYRYLIPEGQSHHWDDLKYEFTLGETLAEAHAVFAERMARVEAEFSADLEFPTMRTLIDRYLTVITPTKKPATQGPERRFAAALMDIYGHMPPASVTHRTINKVKTATAAKRGARTANAHLALLSHVFTMALEWGAIDEHPMLNKKVRRVPDKGSKSVNKYIPTPDELQKAIRRAPPLLKAYVQIKDRTGLRMTDMLQIRLSDIKPDGMHVTISKTGNKRIYELTDDLGYWIDFARRQNRSRAISGYLFQTRDGNPYINAKGDCSGFTSMWRRWQDKCVKDGLPRFAERYLRSKVANEAESLEAARELLDHASETTTRKHYRTTPDRVVPLRKK